MGPIQQLLGGGSPLEHMAKLAKNLLTTPEGNQIIHRIGNLLDTKGGGNPLTSIIKPASEVVGKAVEETAKISGTGVGKAVEEAVKPAISVAAPGASEAIASASKDEDKGIDKRTFFIRAIRSKPSFQYLTK